MSSNSAPINTVYDCFESKSEYTKQSLRELNEQMKKFDFAKANKQLKRHATSNDVDPISDDDVSDDVSDVVSEDSDYRPNDKKSGRNKRARRKHTNKDDNTANQMMIEFQKRIEKLKLVVNKQSQELDKVEIDLYMRTIELSNKAVDLEDAKDAHNKFVKMHLDIVAEQKATIRTYKIYIVGSIFATVAMFINTLNYVSNHC